MRLSGSLLVASLGAAACSVYSEKLLTDSANSIADGGGVSDGGTGGVSSAGSSGSSSGNGSGSGGDGSGGSAGSSSTGGGGSAGSAGSGSGGATCVEIGEGGAQQLDCCPDDTLKDDPGVCGCGIPDADGDGDGAMDCVDGCAMDPAKTEPGTCGCGHADTACDELETALIHRYSFGGTGTEATDSIGAAHGTIVDGMLGNGVVTLAGAQTNQYVDLPDGLISSLSNATFEIWASLTGVGSWQRLFDFGDQNSGGSMTGNSYLFFTPINMPGLPRLVYRKPGGSEVIINSPDAFPLAQLAHVAAVIDDTNNTMSLYVEGALKGSIAFPDSLSLLLDTNNWLGRSNYNVDPEFTGSISEFRIYNVALNAEQIALSAELGPDPVFLGQ